MNTDDIYGYIKSQESTYKFPIQVTDTWEWSMKDHIQTTVNYTNSQLNGGKDEFTPVKNITRPILNLQHRTEDIDVKDVEIYVDDPDKYHLSLLVKKYHDDIFVEEYDLDTFFDELNTSRIDFGGGLSKQLDHPCPEVVPLQSIVFCDQTDILSGPIGIKHFYSPDQLLEMGKFGWGKESNGATASLEEVIELSREEKKSDTNGQVTKTPGRYIEVYEVHGNLPKYYADPKNDSGKYETRLFIVCFYTPQNSQQKQGIILYTAPEKKSPFKLIKRDPVYGRALGFGGAEELFEPQVWVNYDMIRMQQLLDAAAKTIMITNDPTLVAKHPSGLKDIDNLEFIEEEIGGNTRQLDTFPRNLKLFETSIANWESHAQQLGAANDAIMGESPSSGTPFKLQELVVSTNQGLHDYRRGQYAKHLEEIYKDWIIPYIEKKICDGASFLSELSLDEIQFVSERLTANKVNFFIKEKILNGEVFSDQEVEDFKTKVEDEFKKKGNKHFITILKGEFKDAALSVKVNIAGKQKNLSGMVDKVTNILRFAFSNPQGFSQVMQIPGMAKSFNEILEFSGLSPADFSGIDKIIPPEPQPGQAQGQIPGQPQGQMPMQAPVAQNG